MRRLVNVAREPLSRNSVLIRNASSLVLGSGSAAALGFAYWWLAARSFTPVEVGVQSALISTMALIGLLGEAGFGALLLGETMRHGDRASGLIAAATVAGLGSAAALAVPAAVLLMLHGWMDATAAAVFVVGCALTGLSLVLDQAFTGLLRSSLQLYRSVLFSVVKLVLLVGLAAVSQDKAAILLAWVIGLAISVGAACGYAWARSVMRVTMPDFRWLYSCTRAVIDHHLLNLAAAAPSNVLPLLVGLLLSPEVNAAFYAGWMVLSIASFVPASLTTVLFSMGASKPSALAQRLRFSLALTLAFALVCGIVFLMFPRGILLVFNPAYPALAGSAVQLFGLGLLGMAVKFHYILLARLRRRMLLAAAWLSGGGCLEVLAAAAGGAFGGIRWLTVGWTVALAVEAAMLLKPILRAARLYRPLQLALRSLRPAERAN